MPDPANTRSTFPATAASDSTQEPDWRRYGHICHWPGCHERIPTEHWSCAYHWEQLPDEIRDRLHHTYQPELGSTRHVTAAYISALHAARSWIKRNQAMH